MHGYEPLPFSFFVAVETAKSLLRNDGGIMRSIFRDRHRHAVRFQANGEPVRGEWNSEAQTFRAN